MKIEFLSCVNFECRFPDGFLRFKCGRGNWSIDDIQAVFSSTPRLGEDLLIFSHFKFWECFNQIDSFGFHISFWGGYKLAMMMMVMMVLIPVDFIANFLCAD